MSGAVAAGTTASYIPPRDAVGNYPIQVIAPLERQTMSSTRPARVGNIAAAVRKIAPVDGRATDASARVALDRQLVANLCRMLDPQPGSAMTGIAEAAGGIQGARRLARAAAGLSPRMRQTLERLLNGDSEKEIAARFGRSRHTVHVYVKKLYQRYGVSSRGELFALFVHAPASGPQSA